jgi:hypothetical protein
VIGEKPFIVRDEARARCVGCGEASDVVVHLPRRPGLGICERCSRYAAARFDEYAATIREFRAKQTEKADGSAP